MIENLANIKAALRLNQTAYSAVLRQLRAGDTGLELYDIVAHACIRETGQAVPLTGDFLIGAECAGIAGLPAQAALKAGDTVIADLLTCVGDGFCDTTRTFFAGMPDAEVQKAYAAVLKALRAGEAMLRPGTLAKDIHAAVSAALVAEGQPPLPHHAGHRVGPSWMEQPDFVPECAAPIQAGMVVTLEPGVYSPGAYGIRVENNYLVTANGPVNLFPYPEELEAVLIDEYQA